MLTNGFWGSFGWYIWGSVRELLKLGLDDGTCHAQYLLVKDFLVRCPEMTKTCRSERAKVNLSLDEVKLVCFR